MCMIIWCFLVNRGALASDALDGSLSDYVEACSSSQRRYVAPATHIKATYILLNLFAYEVR